MEVKPVAAGNVRIERLQRGEIVINIGGDCLVHFRHCIVATTGAGVWNWEMTGTHHDPGVQIADVKTAIDFDGAASVVVIGTGMEGKLGVMRETKEYLAGRGIECVVAKTDEAAEKFNAFVGEGKRVCGLFHTTC